MIGIEDDKTIGQARKDSNLAPAGASTDGLEYNWFTRRHATDPLNGKLGRLET